YESPVSGLLRRVVAQAGETLPVGALIAVVAEADATDAEIDAFIADFQANFVPEAADAEGGPLAVSTVEAGGRTIRLGRAGPEAGAPVVLIHGYAGDLNNWQFNVEALAAKAPVIAIDLPGHGGSSKDVGDASLSGLAEAVGGALDASGVTAAHLVGHSLGGAVAARLAADRPELARSLTLICPAYLPGTAVSEDFLTGVIEAQRAKDLKPVLEQLLADPGAVTKDMVEDMLKFKRTDGVEEALSAVRDRMLAGADAAALQADLDRLPQTLVIASDADRIVGAPDEAALPRQFRVVWIEGAGHMPHLEQASAVNALLLEMVG
ncbi:MAG: acetoin dehydrogenase dihydrolipoyllysine-residue acetyltransferase subunit, partial [Proteobacteria bacterium]|nr:acetoin dehydrogenase dihydrolipoyllysine-residue acetyltransferase subunit [Pseudomonadota bacterium]